MPEWLGANIAFSGLEALTAVPAGSKIWLPNGAILSVEGENEPCVLPGKEIARHFSSVEAKDFCKAAKGLRGLVGVVYRAETRSFFSVSCKVSLLLRQKPVRNSTAAKIIEIPQYPQKLIEAGNWKRTTAAAAAINGRINRSCLYSGTLKSSCR